MKEFATDYRQLSNDDLLQLWVERSQLVDEAKEALSEAALREKLNLLPIDGLSHSPVLACHFVGGFMPSETYCGPNVH